MSTNEGPKQESVKTEQAPEKAIKLFSFETDVIDLATIVANNSNSEAIQRFKRQITTELGKQKIIPFFINTELPLPKAIQLMGRIEKDEAYAALNDAVKRYFSGLGLKYNPTGAYHPYSDNPS